MNVQSAWPWSGGRWLGGGGVRPPRRTRPPLEIAGRQPAERASLAPRRRRPPRVRHAVSWRTCHADQRHAAHHAARHAARLGGPAGSLPWSRRQLPASRPSTSRRSTGTTRPSAPSPRPTRPGGRSSRTRCSASWCARRWPTTRTSTSPRGASRSRAPTSGWHAPRACPRWTWAWMCRARGSRRRARPSRSPTGSAATSARRWAPPGSSTCGAACVARPRRPGPTTWPASTVGAPCWWRSSATSRRPTSSC